MASKKIDDKLDDILNSIEKLESDVESSMPSRLKKYNFNDDSDIDNLLDQIAGDIKNDSRYFNDIALKTDSKFEVTITSDRLRAFCNYKPGDEFELKKIESILHDNKIYNYIDRDWFYDILKNSWEKKENIEDLLIAEGQAPKNGKDGELIFHYARDEGTKKFIEDESGRVDWHDCNFIPNVGKGDKLITIIPPISGIHGMTCTGDIIKAYNGEPVNIEVGENVELKEEENVYYSCIDGQVLEEKACISVLPVYNVEGDVDFSVGNIDFVGNVVIRGSIVDGFRVKARGNVTVYGNIGACTVIAGGDIIGVNGILGKNTGFVDCQGTVYARFIENSKLFVLGEVLVKKAILHSEISTNSSIIVKSNRGLIVGGVFYAMNKIEAKVIGAKYYTKTELILGRDIIIEKQFIALNKTIEMYHKGLERITYSLNTIVKSNKNNIKNLGEAKKNKLLEIISKQKQMKAQLVGLEKDKMDLYEKLIKNRKSMVKVVDSIYPGVNITIGRSNLTIKEEFHYCSFYENIKAGEVALGPF